MRLFIGGQFLVRTLETYFCDKVWVDTIFRGAFVECFLFLNSREISLVHILCEGYSRFLSGIRDFGCCLTLTPGEAQRILLFSNVKVAGQLVFYRGALCHFRRNYSKVSLNLRGGF